MRPTVGRIVHYVTLNGPAAAVVTRVDSDTGVSLTVLQPDRPLAHRQHVTEGENPGQWMWPPREVAAEAAAPESEGPESDTHDQEVTPDE